MEIIRADGEVEKTFLWWAFTRPSQTDSRPSRRFMAEVTELELFEPNHREFYG